ncbi:DUF4232 domain-containing protein [Streptomyces sp. NPDC059255]|uniref:DUF4232 domain-containing protein n=1 Tax=Streptomyces sp. NPDC059255 TaxID=3346793 RepID=UPI003683D5F7
MSDHFQTSGAVPRWPRRPRRASAAPPGRRRGAWRTATLAASVSLLALATAACGSGGGASSGPEASAPAATSAGTAAGSGTAGDTTGGSGTSSAPPSSSAPAASAPPVSSASGTSPGEPGDGGQAVTTASRCTAARLGLSLSAPNPGAGQIYYDLRLINKGPGSCTLRGFPGVSLLAGDGAPIGRPATREGGTLPAVTLAPGAAAHITLHTLNKGIKGSSCWPRPSLLQIYPPDSKDAMTLATSRPVVCGDTFTVSAVAAS